MANRLARMLVDLNVTPSAEGEPQVHWLLTGLMVSSAMWAVLIAVIVAAFGHWVIAAGLLGLAVILVGLLLAFRRARRTGRGN